jgi:hypothetical protein
MTTKKVAPAKAQPAAPKKKPRQTARQRALARDAAKLADDASASAAAAALAKKAAPIKKAEPKPTEPTFDLLAEVNKIVAPSKTFPDGTGELPRSVFAAAFAERFGRKSTTIYPIRLVRLTQEERDALIAVLLDIKAGKIVAPVRAARGSPSKNELLKQIAGKLAAVTGILTTAHEVAKTNAELRRAIGEALAAISGEEATS